MNDKKRNRIVDVSSFAKKCKNLKELFAKAKKGDISIEKIPIAFSYAKLISLKKDFAIIKLPPESNLGRMVSRKVIMPFQGDYEYRLSPGEESHF